MGNLGKSSTQRDAAPGRLVSSGGYPPWSLTNWPWRVVELEDKDAFPIGTIRCNFSAHVLRTFSGLNFWSSVVGIRYFETPDTRKGSAEKGPTPGKNHWIPECEQGSLLYQVFHLGGSNLMQIYGDFMVILRDFLYYSVLFGLGW